ncbi:hypothetical protein CFC21_103192 [Triticum aestivum]|uniref:Uncharacterized protein n=2 Tax=Triticum aestivum TaxID=4565 RepID=A0A9R1N634_WHEAT|nr:uncharacterized protein LOC123158974 [Triticum aestivum]KAF7101995.1 hypothetical protein CFC21_103192 [Triticum aestivum]
MLEGKPVPYHPPIGAGAGCGDVKGAWTGQKRHKYEAPSLTSSSDAYGETIGQDNEERPNEIADSPDELAGLENDIVSEEEFLGCLKVLTTRRAPMIITGRRLDEEHQRKLYERLTLYRIKAPKLAQGVCIDDQKDVTLGNEYSPDNLEDLFDYYKNADSLDWYFDRGYSLLADLDDYQSLVLKNGDDGRRFCDWETYRSLFTSYEIDEEYVKLFEEISKKIKWLKRYMEYERASSKWKEMDDRGFCQAAKIAAGFPRMSYKLTLMAYEDMDRLFFEIWKFATKKMGATDKKIDFRAGLVDVCRRNILPRYRKRMEFALDHSSLSDLESNFDTCVEDIPDDATEDGACRLIRSAVWNKLHKPMMWHEYILRKMKIAKHIGLGP